MFKVVGKIYKIGDVNQISASFKKRELILLIENEAKPEFSDYISFEATQGNTSILDPMSAGDKVEVEFFVNGRLWKKDGQEEKAFSSLTVKSVTVLEMGKSATAGIKSPVTLSPSPAANVNSDLPF